MEVVLVVGVACVAAPAGRVGGGRRARTHGHVRCERLSVCLATYLAHLWMRDVQLMYNISN